MKFRTKFFIEKSIMVTLGFLLLLIPTVPSFAQDDDDVAPAPPSIGADIPLTYFGPAPSEVQRELIGPYQLLRSGNVDLNASTITLPLYQGQVKVDDGSG